MMRKQLFLLDCAIRHPRTFIEYRRLITQQQMSRDELFAYNWALRKKILLHAYETSPFYGALYRSAGFHPHDLVTPADWCKVPVLRRSQIAECRAQIVSTTATSKDLFSVATGGSTGSVLQSYHDTRYPLGIIGWRMLESWGLDPSVHMACIYRATENINHRHHSWIATRLKEYVSKQILLDASSMTEASAKDFLNKYNRLGPAILHGYVGGLNHLAEYLCMRDMNIQRPLAVWSTAGPISSVQRSLFERTFDAPIYDQYGSCEVYWIAAECTRHEGLHINSDVRHVDFIGENGEDVAFGSTGEIAVTDLVNYAFPLIRYLNGDMGYAIEKPCSCGIKFPLMGSVGGRVSETMVFPNQVAISGEYLTTIFDSYPEVVRAFQVVQRKDLSLHVRVVPNVHEAALAPILEIVKMQLNQKTGGCVPICISSVDSISSDRGKLRYIIKE